MFVYLEQIKESTKKATGVNEFSNVTLFKIIIKNQFYFYILATNYWKLKLKIPLVRGEWGRDSGEKGFQELL